MRVTNKMMFDVASSQIGGARDRTVKAQQEVTTGMRVVHPGDDPAAAGLMVSYQASIDRFTAIDQSTSRASEEVQVADGSLQDVSTLLQRANVLAVQLGNDTNSASERAAGAQEVQDIFGQLVRVMNTQVAGRYIFGGNVDQSPPFDAAGNYAGDANVRQVETAPGLLQAASVRADQALKGVGGGVDVFAALTSLTTALSTNDGTGIRSAIGNVGQSINQIASALSQTGGMLSSFDSAKNVGSVAKDSATKVLASVSESDIFDATSRLTLAQQALEATLAVSARSFNTSLLDFLK